MWALVRRLREGGVTIILTTHYIDEAEEMADRIGVINKGELILVEEKAPLMQELGERQLTLNLQDADGRAARPRWRDWPLALKAGGNQLSSRSTREPPSPPRIAHAAAAPGRAGHRLQGPQHPPELAGRDPRESGRASDHRWGAA